jgi:hypothetical protein|tara:strand:+ start:1250 stop:1501 length:252 start_codon:yes stop_codon:yes gene_type:complete
MLIKKDYNQTLVRVYTEHEGGFYTIYPIQHYDGLEDEYSVVYQDGLGERWGDLWGVSRLDSEFGYKISTIFDKVVKEFELTIK